ncbi:GntR family transcriptional regulator [Rhizobium oryzicola]|uniref:GntR family transcriptional regulator n=1 Tax=Rhizobium oryzicola TaxID=1232668 RepID=A0ABT8SYH6_9HYPH|nr:GntR family transcriptional regulator [Rhizobium oryzicola]MDO1583406.1 GntR family transcriptional regulator [Rhizobium oryzicola]
MRDVREEDFEQPSPATATDLADDDGQRPVEKAYDGIRRAILRGILKPGDHLTEEMLATMTGTSRTPVREALRRLVAEGLATVQNRHRFVTEFSYEEVSIIFDMRARMEGYAAAIAAEKITADELAQLQRIIDETAEIEQDKSDEVIDRFMSLNDAFHTIIVEATRSAHLKQLTAPAVVLPLILLKQYVIEQRVDVVRSNRQHRDILAALQLRNSEWASAAMTGHILSTKPRPRDAARKS